MESNQLNVTAESMTSDQQFLNWTYKDSELVIGLVGAVGTDKHLIIKILRERLRIYNYDVVEISISKDVISKIYGKVDKRDEYDRISTLMDLGNRAREEAKDNSILALGVANEISNKRDTPNQPKPRTAYIINSLKHPKEVELLREIYSTGFYLIGIHADEKRRLEYLEKDKNIDPERSKKLIARDMNEDTGHGQQTRDTFQLSDFFIYLGQNHDQLKKSIWRILDLIFGHPHLTPTFEEFAMFFAFMSALRSADLSRQVGAVIARNEEIIASGANDSPRYGGGLYWPYYDDKTHEIVDADNGRDYKRGYDSNKKEQAKIVDEISEDLELDEEGKEKLRKSSIREITEYGRVVHAEMEAILMCARNNITTRGATIYCTTFPCHNCAKHIIASGIERVVYIEPYPKSKAFEFHDDSITDDPSEKHNKVIFEPFVGIGPRRFFELFSMSLGNGFQKKRKSTTGQALDWKPENAHMRLQLLPFHYLDNENVATELFIRKLRRIQNDNEGVQESTAK